MNRTDFFRVLCFVFAVAAKLPGQDLVRNTSQNNPWVTIASSHFEVRTNASEKTGREILAHFEQVRGLFFRGLKDTRVTSERVSVVAFASEEDFAPYRIKEFAHGYYYRSENREVIVLLV